MDNLQFSPERLIWARKRSGLNQSALAKLVGVDSRAVRAWEAGEYEPTGNSLQKLLHTLALPIGYFTLPGMSGPEPSQASFRSLSKMSATKRDIALAKGAFAFELSSWLEQQFNLPDQDIPDLGKGIDPETAALALRQHWGLGQAPVANMVHLLEAKGVRVFSLAIDAREVDAFNVWNDSTPFIFLNTKKSAAHGRFDAAHELAHLVLHRHGEYNGQASEKEANDFASAFLMPKEDILARAPQFPTISSLIKAKKRWGVSAAALTVRMYKTGMLSDWQYRTIFKQLSQAGLRSSEIDDEQRERSKVLEFCFQDLLKQGKTVKSVSEELFFSENDIKELIFDLATVSINGGNAAPIGNRSFAPRLVVDNTKNQ